MKKNSLLLLLLALIPFILYAQEETDGNGKEPVVTSESGDSLEVSIDSTEVVPDSAISAPQGAEELKKKNPRTAMLLSAFIPGGGQLYNRSFWKVPFIAAGEITLGYLTVNEHLAMRQAGKDTSLTTEEKDSLVNSHMDSRNTFGFFTLAVIAFSMADAYVDAHMFSFKKAQTLSLCLPEHGIGLAVRYNF